MAADAKTRPPDLRNRSAMARAKGLRLVAFTIHPETDAAIDAAVAHLKERQGGCTRVQALEWLVREGAKKIRKKSAKSA